MKKRLLCLVLAAVMTVSVCLTGCGSKETQQPAASESTEEAAEPEAEKELEEATIQL